MLTFKKMFSEETKYKGIFSSGDNLFLGVNENGKIHSLTVNEYKSLEIQEKINSTYESAFIRTIISEMTYESKNELKTKELDFISKVDFILDHGGKYIPDTLNTINCLDGGV